MSNLNIKQTEMNNSSQSLISEEEKNQIKTDIEKKIEKKIILSRVWENKYYKGLEELFNEWLFDGYQYDIKFYRGRKDRKEFLKFFKSILDNDFIEYPMSFQLVWRHFKEWYDFRCHMIYNTLYLNKKSYK